MAKLSLSFKGRPIAVHHFNESSEATTIGRSPACTLVIDSLAVAPIHAKIIATPTGSLITAVTDEMATLVNNHPITEHLLAHGDIIQIGKHTLTFAEDGQIVGPLTTATTSIKPRIFKPPSMAPNIHTPSHNNTGLKGISDNDLAAVKQQSQLKTCVQIVNGNHFGKVISIESGLTRLGFVGLASAAIAHRKDGYFLSHLEGSKPPSVNGHSIKEQSQQLFDGDNIQIGNVRMIFHHQRTTISSQIAVEGG
ncbi:MAG: FHA domain-containing protein [Candidatus Polarisedimenticolaceae bacterium]|nr:FHA domain-containing protein [Candidatus Polarisedimenticolaceae bacterium]